MTELHFAPSAPIKLLRMPTLPPPKKLLAHEVMETGGNARPVLNCTIVRGYWIFRQELEVTIWGGAWLARASQHPVVKNK